MAAFEGIANTASAFLVGAPVAHSIHPGAEPRELDISVYLTGGNRFPAVPASGDADDPWLERTRAVARQAREAAHAAGDSPTALARLAHAELAAGDLDAAESAAIRTLDTIVSTRQRDPGVRVDVPAAVSAAQALIARGQAERAGSYLAKLPVSLPVALIRASLAMAAKDYATALALLAGHQSPAASGLRGYAYLQLGEIQRARDELLRADRTGDPSPDVYVNLAAAFWRLGSKQKAIRFIHQALSLSPRRGDIRLALLDYLILSQDLDAAEAEVRRIHDIHPRGAFDAPELLIRRAQIAFARGDYERVVKLLRQAESRARAAGQAELAAEISGRLAWVRVTAGAAGRAEALDRVRGLIATQPGNLTLVEIFADLCDRCSMASELRGYHDGLAGSETPADLLPVRAWLAFLEADFEEYAVLASRLSKSQPFDPAAADVALLMDACTSLDWRRAARTARTLLASFPFDARVANDAAYIFILAGQPELADQALDGIPGPVRDTDYPLVATRGLARIATGDIQAGLRLYRQAAEMADRSPQQGTSRLLVTLYQGFCLHLIGVFDDVVSLATRAAALPAVPLPPDWQDIPDLRLLYWVCQRVQCPWPPMLA